LDFLSFLVAFFDAMVFLLSLGLPPRAVKHLYANPGPNVQSTGSQKPSLVECGGWDGGILSMRPAQPEIMLNKSTSLEKLNADNTAGIHNSWLVGLSEKSNQLVRFAR
jgi:hypothetical protein